MQGTLTVSRDFCKGILRERLFKVTVSRRFQDQEIKCLPVVRRSIFESTTQSYPKKTPAIPILTNSTL